MEAWDKRRTGERREADQHNGEGRRIDKARRIWNRRHGERGEWPMAASMTGVGRTPHFSQSSDSSCCGGFVV